MFYYYDDDFGAGNGTVSSIEIWSIGTAACVLFTFSPIAVRWLSGEAFGVDAQVNRLNGNLDLLLIKHKQ